MHCMGSNSSNSIAKTRLEYVGSLTSHCIISTCKPFWEPMENGDTLGRAVSKIDAISTQEEYKVLLDLHVQYEDSTQAASNSHFSSLDQQPQYRMSLQQIAIDANAYNRWKQIATAQGLITDTQIANFLTQHYEVTVSGGQYAICCLTCHTPLSLLCAKCRLMQQHTDLNQSCSLSLQTSGESETPSNTADASLQENNQPASTKREILKNEVLSLPAFNFGSRDNSLPFESSFASSSQTSGLTTLVNLQIENHEILSDGSQTNEQNVTSETKGSVTRKLKGKGTKFKDKKDITCKECGCQVPHYVNAKKHSVVSSADRSHVCHDCGAAFAHSRNLKAHFWKKHSSLEKPFQCEVCEKSFLNLRDLQTHTYKHTGELPYKCSYCPSAFRLACNLKTHLRVHTGERPFKCNMCEKAFTESGALKVHVRKHTGEKPFKCNRCEMAFPSSGNLARHVLTHTGEKPYRCTHCEAAFSQPSSLKTHIRTHTGERPYKCEHCGAAFSDNSTLWKHKRKHSCQGSIHVRNKKPAVIISPTLTAELPLGLVAGLQAVEAEAQISTTETAVMVTQSTASSPPTVLIPGARSSQGAIITSNGQHTQNSQHTLFIAHTLPETSLVNTVGWCFPMQ